MPWTRTNPPLPFAGRTPTSRHASYLAAVDVSRCRVRKSEQYVAWLRAVGLATDWGAAEHFGWPLSSVCSIRNGLVDRGLVMVAGLAQGRYGRRVTVWQAVEGTWRVDGSSRKV